ncbi:MAG: 50S ribosomal protein L19e [archaeon]|nr:50S ribosomal protein L19e [Candidatus Micrarchaeota archaeon]
MQLNKIKKIAAGILKVGESRVWMDPDKTPRIKESITKDDVRNLIKEGIIKKRKKAEHSRSRARKLKEKKRKGRKRGYGKRKGSGKARAKKKMEWIKKVRSQRRTLKELKEKKLVKGKGMYGKIYKMIKGNYFKGKKYVEEMAKGAKK